MLIVNLCVFNLIVNVNFIVILILINDLLLSLLNGLGGLCRRRLLVELLHGPVH